MSRVGRSSGVRYRDLFRDREFSALFIADVSSRIGSQLGKFALAALVYNQTKSPGLTAATFAVSYLPGILGGPLLSTLADRWPRRPLLISCDLARAGLMATIALIDMPILVALAILLLVELVRVPFGSARMAMLSDILSGERFSAGNALVGASQQAVQVIGFGVGAAVVTTLGARVALLSDTTSYLVSACLLALFIRPRPAPQDPKRERPRLFRDAFAGVRVVRETGQLPTLFWLLFLGPTALATAEGLAIPYADAIGADQHMAGLFLAVTPLGSVLGLTVIGKLSHRQRDRVLIPFSVVVGGCVALAGLLPVPAVIVGALFLAGVAMGHMAHIQASIVGLISTDVRGRVIGLGQTVLQIGQASALLLAGFVAQVTSVQGVLLYTGICASVAVLVVSSVGSPHASKHRADPRARRRDARLQRQLAKNARRRLASAAFYYDYYYEEYTPDQSAPQLPLEPETIPTPEQPIRIPVRSGRRPLFADEVEPEPLAEIAAEKQPEPTDFTDTARIPRVGGTQPAAQRYDWTAHHRDTPANGQQPPSAPIPALQNGQPQQNGQRPAAYANGAGNGHANGNGQANGNGRANGYSNGNAHSNSHNGYAHPNGNGYSNGNGSSNGHANANGNGHSNGHAANGYGNGYGNGSTDGATPNAEQPTADQPSVPQPYAWPPTALRNGHQNGSHQNGSEPTDAWNGQTPNEQTKNGQGQNGHPDRYPPDDYLPVDAAPFHRPPAARRR